MPETEQQIQSRIRLAVSGPGSGVRLWRQNCGKGWAGPAQRVDQANLGAMRASLQPGDVVVRRGRILEAGLTPGSGDLIGIRPVVISAEHIGQRLGVFASIEVKVPKGRVSPEQQQWLQIVQSLGGIAGVARSVEDAQQLMGLVR
jgi:hypothetical protein